MREYRKRREPSVTTVTTAVTSENTQQAATPAHDPALMGAIARATGGRTFTADSTEALSGVYSHLGGTVARETTNREIGSWFALAAGVLLVGALGLGRLLGSVLL